MVLMAQPFRAYAKTLLEVQRYPVRKVAPGMEPERPYDVAGWTLPLQMGVQVDRVEQTFEPPPSTRLVRSTIAPGSLRGEPRASYYVVDARGNAGSLALNRLQAAGLDVSWTTAPLAARGFGYAAGSIIVQEAPRARAIVEKVVTALGLRAAALPGPLPQALMPLGRARVGLYKPWVENIDEGWTRWLLERYEFPFESLADHDLRRGGLRTRVDVIIVPDQSAERLMNGHPSGTMPPEYTGGIGAAGALALKQFVDDGGTLVALDSASELAIHALGLPVQDVVRGAPPEQFFVPGSILRLTLDGGHALAYGMPTETGAFFAFGSAFDVRPNQPSGNETASIPPSAQIVASYAAHDVLLSGWLEGEALIAGRGAVVEAHSGQGRAVLFGFRAQHRAQSHATFRLLFNALHTSARPLPRPRSGGR